MAATTSDLVVAILAVLLFILLTLSRRVRNSKVTKFAQSFPQPPRLPFVGSMHLLNVPNELLTKWYTCDWQKSYGPRFCIQIGPRYYFSSTMYTDAEKLLTSSDHIDKGDLYKFLLDWLGTGSITSSGAKWSTRRKLLTPTFHFKILEEFLPILDSEARIFVEILHHDSQGGEKELEVCEYVARFTLDTICETAMGKRLGTQRNKKSPYLEAVHGMNSLAAYRTVRPWLHADTLWNLSPSGRLHRRYLNVLHDFTNSVIKERKDEMRRRVEAGATMNEEKQKGSSKSKRGQLAFLDLILQYQAKGELTDDDVREETDTFMFAAHDTTASSLAWTVHLLGAHPEHQETAYQEIISVLGDNPARPITSEDLRQMKFLECCIKESLRLYPSVPMVGRYLTQDLVLDKEITVPAGFNLILSVFGIHRDPEVYPEPEEFRPERFFPENCIGRSPFAYIPFSAGPRNCIGQKFAMMELKVGLAHLLRKFRIVSLDKREDVVMTTEVILKPRDGLRVRLIPR